MPPITPYRPRTLEEILAEQNESEASKKKKEDKAKKEKAKKDKTAKEKIRKPLRGKGVDKGTITRGMYKIRNTVIEVKQNLTSYNDYKKFFQHLYEKVRPIKMQSVLMAKDFKKLKEH